MLTAVTRLRKYTSGPDVRALQVALKAAGYDVRPTGSFNDQTDRAVRAFQRRHGLLPDGIAGPKTMRALEKGGSTTKGRSTLASTSGSEDFLVDLILTIGSFIGQSATVAKAQPLPPVTSRSSHAQHMSKNGIRFLYAHESVKGISNHLYWPRGASGVTLGSGYDMKERSPETIARDMLALGLDAETARKVAQASKLTGEKALEFAKANHQLVNLTAQQETQLLYNTVPPYEARVRSRLHVDVMPHEFDAMVSFAYNPGGGFGKTIAHINNGEIADAMAEIQKQVKSGNEILQALVSRRRDEVDLYLYGNYGKLPEIALTGER